MRPLLLLLLSAWPAHAGEGTAPPEQHARMERLYTEGQHQEAALVGQGLLAAYPDDVDLYWMVARAYFEVGELIPREDKAFDKVAWYEKMLAYADAGLVLEPGHPHLLFARGAALARLGTTRGIAASLMLADDVEQAWLSAAENTAPYASLGREEVLPCDIYVCLGVFYRLLPDWWVVEALTGTRGSLTSSRDWLTRAHTCSPDRINVVKEYAATQLCYGQQHNDPAAVGEGMAALQRALSLPIRTEVDVQDHQHVQRLLDEPDLACAYSRDGQVEADRAAIERRLKR